MYTDLEWLNPNFDSDVDRWIT